MTRILDAEEQPREVERRRWPRMPAWDSADMSVIYPAVSGREQVRVVDTSVEGLAVESTSYVPPGAMVQVRYCGQVITARVCHCRREGEGYLAGMNIEEVVPIQPLTVIEGAGKANEEAAKFSLRSKRVED